MDRGKEFAKEVHDMLRNKYGFNRKVVTTRNPQANSVLEQVHSVLHNMVHTFGLRDARDLGDYDWKGILAAVRQAMRSTVHTTTRATPSQLVFNRDAILNTLFKADWQCIKEQKQRLIVQNNRRENAKRIEHTHNVGDKVMIHQDPTANMGPPCTRDPTQ